MNTQLRSSLGGGGGGESQGCIATALTILVLVFIVFPMSLYYKAKESVTETIVNSAVQNIDVVVLNEDGSTLGKHWLKVLERGECVAEHQEEYHNCRLYSVKLKGPLPAGCVKPEYFMEMGERGQSLDELYVIYAILDSSEKARKWLSRNGYSDSDFEFQTLDSGTLSPFIHRKEVSEVRSEIILEAFTAGGKYYILDNKVAHPGDSSPEGEWNQKHRQAYYQLYMKVRQ